MHARVIFRWLWLFDWSINCGRFSKSSSKFVFLISCMVVLASQHDCLNVTISVWAQPNRFRSTCPREFFGFPIFFPWTRTISLALSLGSGAEGRRGRSRICPNLNRISPSVSLPFSAIFWGPLQWYWQGEFHCKGNRKSRANFFLDTEIRSPSALPKPPASLGYVRQ